MPTRDSRLLPLAILILAGLQVVLPWADGGRSPAGQAGLVLLLVLAGAAGVLAHGHALIQPSLLFLLAGLLVGVSTLHTIYPDRTVQSLLLLLAYLLAGTLAAQSVRENPWAESVLLTAIFTSGGLVTTVGLFHLFHRTEGGLYANLLTGPFGYPNAMAGFLLVNGGAALAMVWDNRGSLVRLSALGTAILAIMGLFLTGSRGALLAAMAGSIAWLAVQRQLWRSRRGRWVWLAGFAVLIIILAWVHESTVGDFSRIWSLSRPMEDSSVRWRLHILHWTWTMVWDHPWWGVGPGAFPVALTHYQRLPYVSGENPHNLYLELAAEYGFPAGVLMLSVLGGYLCRMTAAITRVPADDPVRRRLAILLATLVAFLAHSLGDLDWSFPAIAVSVATMLGLTVAHFPATSRQGHGPAPTWRMILIMLLVAGAILSLTRYYASTLVTWGRQELAAGETVRAHRDLMWALRLNPLSYPARQWMARTYLRSGDIDGAVEAAERVARIAPSDPNSLYLAGEINAAAGRWDAAQAWFRRAADLAPAAQLRYHVGLVESFARGGRALEARWWYERAVTIFSPERVLDREARCLAPGDRYLLARMSRIVAPLYGVAGDHSKQQAIENQAQLLAQPDLRGICASRGRPGQTSPEAAAESFWKALAEGGWPLAENFLAPGLRRLQAEDARPAWGRAEWPLRARLVWVAALTGGERQASLLAQVEIQEPSNGRTVLRCAQMALTLIREGWFLAKLPILEAEPCQP